MRVAAALLPLIIASLAGCIGSTPEVPAGTESDATPSHPAPDMWIVQAPLPAEEGRPVNLYLSSDEAVGLGQVVWDFGDGTSQRALEARHTYRQAGTFLVTATAHGDGWTGSYTHEVRVASPDGSVPSTNPAAEPDKEPPLAPPVLHVSLAENRLEASFTWDRSPDSILWDFGDGTTSADAAPTHRYLDTGTFDVLLTLGSGEQTSAARMPVTVESVPFQPHVVVGIGDSGFNVYHDVYSRPDLTAHPCTYIRDYPCNIPALRLSLDEPDYDKALQKDLPIWRSIQPGDRFWIPETNIIFATCQQPYSGSNAGSTDPTGAEDLCILDDSHMHGTGTSSSVLSENPDALLAIAEGNSGAIRDILEADIPVDVISHSWGSAVPLPAVCSSPCTSEPVLVVASGNEGAFPYVLDGDGQRRAVWSVGAADAGSRSEPGYSGWKTMDFVSEYCRPTAQTASTSGVRDRYCGTSFSAPTFAGAISRAIYELRLRSGFTGHVQDGVIDPVLGITETELRRAVNLTATYEPEDKWDDGDDLVPLLVPWYQWGWGYYDSTRVQTTLDCLLRDVCPSRPAETELYMQTLWAARI